VITGLIFALTVASSLVFFAVGRVHGISVGEQRYRQFARTVLRDEYRKRGMPLPPKLIDVLEERV
jgi:hypothetical protein